MACNQDPDAILSYLCRNLGYDRYVIDTGRCFRTSPSRGLGAFLFTTSDGHVLMNTGMPSSGPMIVASIRQLGFTPEDIKLMINGHAHIDHAGAFSFFKSRFGAQLAVMRDDVAAMESGDRDDFKYANDFVYPGVKVVAFPDGAGFNPGYRLVKDPMYPGIAEDYRRTHHFLEMLKPDIWLAQHNEYYDLDGKQARAKTEGVKAWIDPEGYRRFIAGKKRAFEDQVDLEMGSRK